MIKPYFDFNWWPKFVFGFGMDVWLVWSGFSTSFDWTMTFFILQVSISSRYDKDTDHIYTDFLVNLPFMHFQFGTTQNLSELEEDDDEPTDIRDYERPTAEVDRST